MCQCLSYLCVTVLLANPISTETDSFLEYILTTAAVNFIR